MANGTFRPEIQGLRAIAVSAVLLFHLWPDLLPGGYVGVDVFFVISGYLIGGILVREAGGEGTIDLLAFYRRRARRILPAAALVLAVIGLLTPLLMPPVQWRDVSNDIIASALYVENWRLAALAVDYLGIENDASPVQHYWSLSIEEQFYIVWPVLILGVAAASRLIKFRLRTVLLLVFIAVTAASLAASVIATEQDAASAYFLTYTRVWELSFGSVIALWPQNVRAWKRFAAPAGLAAILAAALLFSPGTPFPGYVALLPVLGAALVILGAGTADWFGAGRMLSAQPLQFLGDTSYSIYLWHWPLIVFYQANVPGPIGLVAAVGIVAATVLLSVLTKRFVEDRYRERGSVSRAEPVARRRLYPILASLLAPLLIAGVTLAAISRNPIVVPAEDLYPGAEILMTGARLPKVPDYAPPLTQVKRDMATPMETDCDRLETPLAPCRFGPADGVATVVLIGDSHAQQWLPAFVEIATRRRWNFVIYWKSGCPLVPVLVRQRKKPYHDCLTWGHDVLKEINERRPDLVILTHSYKHEVYAKPEDTDAIMREAELKVFRQISDEGVQVAAIANSPVWSHDPAACIQDARNCVMPLAGHYDPLVAAGHLDPSVALIDVNDYLCPGGRCPAVIGNVVVWRDRHHITATFARTMAAPLAARLDAALSAAGAKTLAKTLAGPKTLAGRKTLESAAASPQKPDHVAPAF